MWWWENGYWCPGVHSYVRGLNVPLKCFGPEMIISTSDWWRIHSLSEACPDFSRCVRKPVKHINVAGKPIHHTNANVGHSWSERLSRLWRAELVGWSIMFVHLGCTRGTDERIHCVKGKRAESWMQNKNMGRYQTILRWVAERKEWNNPSRLIILWLRFVCEWWEDCRRFKKREASQQLTCMKA